MPIPLPRTYAFVTRWLTPLFFCLMALTLVFAAGSSAGANPTVPQGGSATFPKVGMDAPVSGLTWDIVRQGLTVATNSVPNGWTAVYNTTTSQFTVGAPATATVAVSYEVRFNSGAGGGGGGARIEEILPRGRHRRWQCLPQQAQAIGTAASAFFDVTGSGSVRVIGLTLSPTSVVGGNPSTGTVTLSGSAPTGGFLVTLGSNNTGVATVPTNFTITVGRTSGTFTVSTKTVTATTAVTISASGGGGSASATLTVNPASVPNGPVPDVASVSLNPSTVQQDSNGQATSLATVTLTGPALRGGQVVALAASNTAATVPAWLLVPAGQTSATFTVTTTTLTALTTVDISAAYAQNASHSATLTVQPKSATGGPLGLTPAGIARGFGLTTFASNFYNDGLQGPIGMAFGPAGHVYVVDLSSQRFLDFPSDSDGQNAGATPNYPAPPGTADNIVNVDGRFYMNFAYSGNIIQFVVTPTGLQTQPIVTLPVGSGVVDLGMVANPVNGHIFVGNLSAGTIYDVDPIAKTFQVFISGFPGLDGLTISPDGRTLYAVVYLNSNVSKNYIVGYDIPSHALVFTSGFISGADGCAVGRGVLQGKLYVNTNFGAVYEVDLVTAVGTLIASGGTRGDYVRPDPNGTLLLTQTDRICRLVPPQGGSFADVSNVVATRDDLTTSYGPVTLTAPVTSGDASQFGAFDATGFGGSVVFASMQRGGSVSWSGATNFDMQWGLQSLTTGSLVTYGPVQNSVQARTSPYAYVTYWDMPAAAFGLPATNWNLPSLFYADIQGSLGQLYQVALTDQLSAGWGSYTVTDTPEQGWPTLSARNILNFTVYPGNNPDVTQGRALDITLPGADQPLEGDWDILLNGQIIAASLSPNGWNVEVDHQVPHGVWVTVPASATVAPFYEVRFAHGYGSGFFDVIQTVTPPASAPVMLPLVVVPSIVVGGNNATGTVTLDAPAPAGGATVTLICQTYGATVPASVTVPAGQTSATYPITTLSTTTITQAVIFASYNGVRMAVFTIVPTGSTGGLPSGGAALALTATGGPGRVTLNWTAATGASFYTVKRSTAHGGPYGVIATSIRTTQYVDTKVNNGTTYFYVVTASNVYGESVASNEASATPNASVPVAGLRVNPTSVVGGNMAIGTITLSSAAPPGGANVTLSSNNGAATVPSSVFVPAGMTSADFVVNTTPVSANTPVTLSATAGSNTSTATLTVLAPSVLSLTLTPNPVVGGAAATGTVTLNGDTFSSGASVTFSSANTNVATVSPATVSFSSGSRTAIFTVNTTAVTSATSVAITATHASGCNGSATNNLQVNPANIACYISNLTLSPSCIIGTGTSTATVTLSAPAPTGGALVTLKSNNPNVTVPASVVVPANSQTATFTVTDNGVNLGVNSDATYVTIYGSYNTWMQVTTLAALPANYPLVISNLSAVGGQNCTLLNWHDLPSGSIRGYNVYRMVSGTPVLLNTSAPVPSNAYADTGITNGAIYQYQVRVVNQSGTEINTASVTATPDVSAPVLLWRNTPTAPISGTATIYGYTSTGTVKGGFLLVDGYALQPLTPPNSNDLYPDGVQAAFDTSILQNGSHTLQMIGYTNNMAVVSPPLTIQTNNAFSDVSSNGVVEADTGDISSFSFVLPSGTDSWTLQILAFDGTVVRQWSAIGNVAQLAWDGSTANGQAAPEGTYTMQVTALKQGQPQGQQKKSVHKTSGGPQLLACIATDAYPDTPQEAVLTKVWADTLQRYFDEVNKSLQLSYYVTTKDPLEGRWGKGPKQPKGYYLKYWLHNSVTVFYMYTHGIGDGESLGEGFPVKLNQRAAIGALFDGVLFAPTQNDLKTVNEGRQIFGIPIIIDSDVMANRSMPMAFVMLDMCHSAGGALGLDPTIDKPANPRDERWAQAFGIIDAANNPNFEQGALVGWNGDAVANSRKDGSISDWFSWRIAFWIYLCRYGENVLTAKMHADRDTKAQGKTTDKWEPWSDANGSNYFQIIGNGRMTLAGYSN